MNFNDIKTIFTDIANAIRTKTGSSDELLPSEFAEKISEIEGNVSRVVVDPYPTTTFATMRGGYDKLISSNTTDEQCQVIFDSIDWENVEYVDNIANGAVSITKIPMFNPKRLTSLTYAFYGSGVVNGPDECIVFPTTLESMSNMFSNTDLPYLPDFDLSSCASNLSCDSFFESNDVIQYTGDAGDYSRVYSYSSFFKSCTALIVNECTTFRPVICTNMFNTCLSLIDCGDIDMSRCISSSGMFGKCYKLSKGRLKGLVYTVDLSDTIFGFEEDGVTPLTERGLDQLVEDMGTPAKTQKLYVSDAQEAYLVENGLDVILNDKNWTIVV